MSPQVTKRGALVPSEREPEGLPQATASRTASMTFADNIKAAHASELDERMGDALSMDGHTVTVTVPAKKIVTYRLK